MQKNFSKEESLRSFRVLRPIYGVDVALDHAPVEFGDFRVDFGRKLLVAEDQSELLNTVVTSKHQAQLFIQCPIRANDIESAYELADALFYRFELIFRFLLIGTRADWIEVGILNYTGAQMRDGFIFSEDGRPLGGSFGWKGALQKFLFKDERFPQPTPPLNRLFELITRTTNDLERHILRCAEWTGQALAEPNEAAALVKAATALEVLFSVNEKGPITPSIMSQIAESTALLLGSAKYPPIEIEKNVKRLYAERSAVVHSGKDSVASEDLEKFIQICRSAVFHLLTDAELLKIESVIGLSDYFKRKKYAAVSGR